MHKQTKQESNYKSSTFKISINFTKNSTWQGKIHWLEKDLTEDFRSVLEMLKLMDEALTESAQEGKVINW